ncbi:hypothetical protein LINPERHAP1_LOCUS8517 [Linum perenne]
MEDHFELCEVPE